jgi:LuxR family maltose regulon positive regulatory protein
VHKALAQVLLAQGETGTALQLLARLSEAAELAGRTGSLIKILALQALAFSAADITDRALSVLGRALVLAESEGYVRTFLDHGTPMVALLSEIANPECYSQLAERRRPSSEYVHRLLSAFASEGRGASSSGQFTSAQSCMSRPLSSREQEVLRLIAAGCSAWEIARELVITMNTVKTHLKNIYGKLDAHSGKEAAAKARELHLL